MPYPSACLHYVLTIIITSYKLFYINAVSMKYGIIHIILVCIDEQIALYQILLCFVTSTQPCVPFETDNTYLKVQELL